MNDVATLGLPSQDQLQIARVAHENRIEWELWIESAATYNDLQRKLLRRGFAEVPISDKAEFFPPSRKVSGRNIAKLPHQKAMIQRSRKTR